LALKKIDNNTFDEQIKSLNTSVIQEWVELGNKAETFRDSGMKIVLLLDNASFHIPNSMVGFVKNPWYLLHSV